MRLSREAWRQLQPLFRLGSCIEFDYRGNHRLGTVETIGEGPNGALLTVRFPDGSFKNFSLSRIENLKVLRQS